MDMMMGMLPARAPLPLPPDRATSFSRNLLYAQQTWWLISSFILLVSFGQLSSWAAARIFVQRPTSGTINDAELQRAASHRRGRRDWSRLPLASVNYFRVVAFRQTVDIGDFISVTYAEAFITIGYIIAIFTWEFINTTNMAGSMLDWQYWSSRAGAMAVSQFPLVTVLGTKNNLLAYITGVSYDKLNFLHRMTARVAFILLWVHAGGKFAFLRPAVYESWFIRLGLTVLVAFTILNIVAFRPLRARLYELFFFSHFALVLIILIGGWFHADMAARLGPYICACFYIWGGDRLVRLFRVIYYNTNLDSRGAPAGSLKASVELLSPHFVRLRVLRPSRFKWTPGQGAFVIVPGVSRIPFEAHPFTIANVDSRYHLGGRTALKASNSLLNSEANTVNASSLTLTEKPGSSSPSPSWEEVEFYINVRGGFTKRLAEAADKDEEVSVYLDGPYGFSPNLKNDDTVVVVAGGSGVSLALSTFLGVVSDVQQEKSRCRRFALIWCIRDSKQIEWVSSSLINALEFAPPHLDIAIRIFVTGRGKPDDQLTAESSRALAQTSTIATTAAPRMLADFSSVQIIPGRPDIPKILKDEVASATGPLSVTVCGSSAIAKSCRDALRLPFSSVLYGGPSVVLHVESFGYA